MTQSTRRRLTIFERATLEARIDHISAQISYLEKIDINCGQDFRMLLNVAISSGIRQCDIAKYIKARRSKLSCWANGVSVARSRAERQRIADAIQGLLEEKLAQATQLIGEARPKKPDRVSCRHHPDLIL